VSDFFQRFLRLKAQVPEVSDKQAIMQAIKALRVGQLHHHLVRGTKKHSKNYTNNSKSLADQRCHTFISWISKGKQQMRMKVQDHSSTSRAKKAQQVLTWPTNKSTSLTLMEADLWRIGKKTLDLHGRKVRAKCRTQEKIISKTKVATPTGAEAGAEVKKSLCIVCFMRMIRTIGQGIALSSLNPKRR
jgi:hypothetical protein